MALTSHTLAGVVLCACSGSAIDTDAAAPMEAFTTDAKAPACDVSAPFSAPRLLPNVNTPDSDTWGWQTPDQRTLYFSRYVAPYTDGNLHVATREDASASFGDIAPLETVNTVLNERRPIVTGDGLTLLAEASGNQADIRAATRASNNDAFSALTSFANINDDTRNDFNPWISPDGLVLYFTSDRTGNNSIHKALRASANADFADAVLVAEIDSPLGDYMGALSADGLELVFGSRRDTGGENGDLFHAVRSTPTAAFGAPQKLAELSDPVADEYATWLSADRCELLFTSNRPGIGAYDIWIATRY